MFGKSKKPKYYSLSGILEKNADYNIIFGERSNGKTYACLAYMIINYVETGEQSAYVRRWREDLRGKRAESLFSGHVANGFVSQVTKGRTEPHTVSCPMRWMTAQASSSAPDTRNTKSPPMMRPEQVRKKN